MSISKGVITLGGDQHRLALQTMVDVDGQRRSSLEILLRECADAGVRMVAVVVPPGTEPQYLEAAGSLRPIATVMTQREPGYSGAILTCREFIGDSKFLHLVGDHVFVSHTDRPCAQQLVEVANEHDCSVSGVQATRETNLSYFGAVGGTRVPNAEHLYEVDRVAEKPTPTEAEQSLVIPGLRVGHYLCFFGIHVLTPRVFDLLRDANGTPVPGLSEALDRLAREERYLAYQMPGSRFPMDVGYGMMAAQLALGLAGRDREQVLSLVVDLVTQRELSRTRF